MRWLLREYLAMPGLSLTPLQLRRLLALDEAACDALVELLTRAGYLMRREDGRCVRPPRIELAAWRRAVQTALSDTQIGKEVAMSPNDEDHWVDAGAGRLASAVEIDRILCPIDFSANSLRALTHAIAIARRHGSSITALHVLEAGVGTTEVHEADVLDRLHEFVKSTDQGPVYIEAVVTRGSIGLESWNTQSLLRPTCSWSDQDDGPTTSASLWNQ